MAYDIEQFLTDLQATLNANLNTKIAAINAEKNDGITLATVDSNAYFLQDLADKIPVYDPFIVYGELEDSVGQGLGPATAEKYTVAVELALADPGVDPMIKNRLYRYRRALKEVVQDNWDRLGQFSLKSTVKGMMPTPPMKTEDLQVRSIGVTIEVWLA